ncbi:hypothetical protein ACLOJK_015262, partial [Asimina triloba]
ATDGMDEGGGCRQRAAGQRAKAAAGTWAATSAVGAGEAVAVAACWLMGVLADDGDGGQHDEWPGSTDPGLVDDEKWRQQLLGKWMTGWAREENALGCLRDDPFLDPNQ